MIWRILDESAFTQSCHDGGAPWPELPLLLGLQHPGLGQRNIRSTLSDTATLKPLSSAFGSALRGWVWSFLSFTVLAAWRAVSGTNQEKHRL